MRIRPFWHLISCTVRLWQLLKQPPTHHPAYQQAAQQQHRQTHTMTWGILGLIVFYITISLIASNTLTTSTPGSINRYVMVMFGLPLGLFLVIFSGTTYGALWSGRIASDLAAAHQNTIHDLLALTALGSGGVNWVLAMGALHRDRVITNIPAIEMPFSRHARWIPLLVALVFILDVDTREIIRVVLLATGVFFAVYIDYVQSCELALLVGLHTAERAATIEEARTGAVTGFLALQFAAYIAIGLAILTFAWLTRQSLLQYGGIPQLLIFYLGREPLIAVLWHYSQPFLRVIPRRT